MESKYKIRDPIDVIGTVHPFLGSVYEGTIVGHCCASHYEVEYLTLFDENTGERFREVMPECKIKRPPLFIYKEAYGLGDLVSVWQDKGWWVGTVTKTRAQPGKYEVFLHFRNEVVEVKRSKMRPHA